MSLSLPPSSSLSDGSIVAHVVVVGFHAQLGNRIEFAYPRLRGDPVLRSPKVTDTSDISSDSTTPTLSHQRQRIRDIHSFAVSSVHTAQSSSPSIPPQRPPPPSQTNRADDYSKPVLQTSKLAPATSTNTLPSPLSSNSDVHTWGILPDEWTFLPFMALPDGAHDQAQDVVFFTLPPDVHCVSHFRQVHAHSAKTHSASATTGSYERSVASRGSVQKSVVLLCRRPLFGALADRLIPAVRAYFEQADFADTHVLSSLYHSLNLSLSTRPSLSSSPDTLFHGLDLRSLVRRLGPQLIAVIKLVLLERRVVIYSQPVRHASNAVVALASVFPGSLDTVAPTMRPLDVRQGDRAAGLPLALFGQMDRVVLQPYAPLPLVSQLVPNNSKMGCLIGTSHNVGLLLSSTAAAHTRKAAALREKIANGEIVPSSEEEEDDDVVLSKGRRRRENGKYDVSVAVKETVQEAMTGVVGPTKRQQQRMQQSSSNPEQRSSHGRPPAPRPVQTTSLPGGSVSSKIATSTQLSRTMPPPGGGVPIVDALVNLSTGRVSVSAALEPLCRVTAPERQLMRDLVVAASRTGASVSAASGGSTGPFIGSDDYIRSRLRQYIVRLLQSMSSVPGMLGGPVGGETWSVEMAADFNLSPLHDYNEQFVRRWVTTANAAQWARACTNPPSISVVPPPKPEVEPGLADETADRVAAGLSGLRRNVADIGRFSSIVSAKAAEGIAGIFKRIELEVAKMDTAVGQANSTQNSSRVVGRQVEEERVVDGDGDELGKDEDGVDKMQSAISKEKDGDENDT